MSKGRLACYARVSSHEQDKSETIITQRYWLEKWATENDWQIAGWYGDVDCQSWIPIAERLEGGRLLRDAARRKFDAVAIYTLGRWSRYLEVWREGQRELKKLGIDLICINENTDDDRPGERFSLNVRLLVNEYERDNLASNCLDGRYHRAARGGYVGGVVPYGYCVIGERRRGGRQLAIDEEEAAVVRYIFRLIVEEGFSTLSVARRLNAEDVPTACSRSGDRHRPYHGTSPGKWHAGRIGEMIRHPIYRGVTTFGEGGAREPVQQEVPAIVDAETWHAAGLCLDRNRNESRRNTRRTYLLRGLLWCEHCKRTLTGRTETSGKREFAYYLCPGRHPEPNGRGYCPLPWLRADEIEGSLWDTLSPLILAHEETATRLRHQMTAQSAQSDGFQAARDGLRAAIGRKQDALKRAVTLATDGLLTRDELQDQRARLDVEIAALAAEDMRLAEQVDALAHQDIRIAAVAVRLATWAARIHDGLTPELRAEVVRAFVYRIPISIRGDVVVPRYVFCVQETEGRLQFARGRSHSPIDDATCSPGVLNWGMFIADGIHWTCAA